MKFGFLFGWRMQFIDWLLVCAVAAAVAGTGIELTRPKPPPYRPAQILPGRELVMVFIASSSCAGIRAPGIDEAIQTLRAVYRAEAQRGKQNFATIGISTDWSVPKGVALLDRFGPFDEVMIGRSWLNSGVIKYVWQDVPGAAAVPQIALIEREISPGELRLVNAERVLVRRAGADAIINWARALEARYKADRTP